MDCPGLYRRYEKTGENIVFKEGEAQRQRHLSYLKLDAIAVVKVDIPVHHLIDRRGSGSCREIHSVLKMEKRFSAMAWSYGFPQLDLTILVSQLEICLGYAWESSTAVELELCGDPPFLFPHGGRMVSRTRFASISDSPVLFEIFSAYRIFLMQSCFPTSGRTVSPSVLTGPAQILRRGCFLPTWCERGGSDEHRITMADPRGLRRCGGRPP